MIVIETRNMLVPDIDRYALGKEGLRKASRSEAWLTSSSPIPTKVSKFHTETHYIGSGYDR
jgi:hypothetical protein